MLHPRPSQNDIYFPGGSLSFMWKQISSRVEGICGKAPLHQKTFRLVSERQHLLKKKLTAKNSESKDHPQILLQLVSRVTCWKYPRDVNLALNRTIASSMGGKPYWFTNLWRHCGEPPTAIVLASADVGTSENLAAKVGGANKKTRKNRSYFPARKKRRTEAEG